MELWALWLIIIVLLSIIELMTINLVTIWFVLSALVSLIISFFTDELMIMFAVFVVGGVLLMIITKPLLGKMQKVKNAKLNLDRIIGSVGVITKEILKHEVGEVKVDGKTWSAISDEKIKLDEKIVVLEIVGVKLKVSKLKEEKEEDKKEAKEKKSKKKRKGGK